ncbi:unnamed protein product [Cochlearia groenlandica]
MPSVGMRRTTSVFGVVKAGDGARVLRSGRRIWPNVDEPKVKQGHDFVDHCLLKNPIKSKGIKISRDLSKPCVLSHVSSEKVEDFTVNKRRKVINEALRDDKSVDKRFGIVYIRKRKRLYEPSCDRLVKIHRSLKFYCRRRRGFSSEQVSSGRLCVPVITLKVDWSCEECWFSSVLSLVMRYLRREELRFSSLSSFFLSRPIKDVFADHGVRFLEEPALRSRGVCEFFGGVNGLPLFSADFAAIPRCFMDMHFTLILKVVPRSYVFVKKSLYLLNNVDVESVSESGLVLSEPCNQRNEAVVRLHPSVRASKLTVGNVQCRFSLGFHSFRKTRSSLRRRKARILSHSVHKFYNGTSLASNGVSIVPKPKTKEELDSLYCSVNVLMIDSDRCAREQGLSVMLEFSSSKEWFVVIKKDGAIRYSHKARKTMRPCSRNRFTHSIVWIGDNNHWKLEFCDKQDWLGFKEIYKECYERNVLEQNARVIHIPGVREVCVYGDEFNDFSSFSRPLQYISVKDGEVSRAMARKMALYDMDSEDEEWLERRNREMSCEGDEESHQLEGDIFELLIDGFEKRYFHSPADDLLDEKAASIVSLSYLGRQEVVEAVHDYWVSKRKQRKAPLLRVFQVHQAKKCPLLFKTVFRKKRSFKRQGSHLNGKAKHLSLVAVKAVEQEASEEQNFLLRVEEAKAKAFADTSTEIAIAKRRRAQVLAENADLAVYKAMIALRIAEAIKAAEPSEVATRLFLN